MKDNNATFLGSGWSFPLVFDPDNKQVTMVSQDHDIQQSLAILFSTACGERLMHPTFGSDLHKVVFDNISTTTITEIQDAVRRAVLFFEPRIYLHAVEVDMSAELYLEGRVDIHVHYTIRTTNTRSNLVFPFYFLEGTNI